MERSLETITGHGLGLCSISYDSVEILRDFAARRGITFPMLADPDSAIIRRFGLLNERVAPDSRDYGVPHPGIFLVDAEGIVRERLFEEDYWHRMTVPAVFYRLGRLMAAGHASVDGEHLRIRTAATDTAVHPGNRFTLFVDLQPRPGVHLYGPAIGGGYQGLEVSLEPAPYLTALPPRYPDADALTLPWTDERLTGYTRPVRVEMDVLLGTRIEMAPLYEAGQGLTLSGTVRYQACDDRTCWPPQATPLTWHFDLRWPDLERPAEHIQHKARVR
ncbi:MAG: redoxin domain-containing protein [Armatimonadetes bacterium]|nr:redoxin domain-containing protein [Armatimonadota bacterium]